MNSFLRFLGCRDWLDFGAMCLCSVLMAAGGLVLFLPVVMSPLWWQQ